MSKDIIERLKQLAKARFLLYTTQEQLDVIIQQAVQRNQNVENNPLVQPIINTRDSLKQEISKIGFNIEY